MQVRTLSGYKRLGAFDSKKFGDVFGSITQGLSTVATGASSIITPFVQSKIQRETNQLQLDLANVNRDLLTSTSQYDRDQLYMKQQGISEALANAGLMARNDPNANKMTLTPLGVAAVGGLVIGGIILFKKKKARR